MVFSAHLAEGAGARKNAWYYEETPKLEVPARNRTRASAVGREHSRKSHSNSMLIAIRNIYI
jgi:hypothetical protein